MIPILYQGSVKDLLGPAKYGDLNAVVFEYTDAFSVFDWGRMPDTLQEKGEALTLFAASVFEKLVQPESWQEFSSSDVAHALRKASPYGAKFVEVGERLQKDGLLTHYLGLAQPEDIESSELKQVRRMAGLDGGRSRHLVATLLEVVKPELSEVMGQSVMDYHVTRQANAPKLVPLEVIFRFGCPEGSSFLKRAKTASYMGGLPTQEVSTEADWTFPVIELSTKLESKDRMVALTEAMAISGLTATQLETMAMYTAWISAYLKYEFGKYDLKLWDGKLEWGISKSGELFLVDAIGPDELRITRNGVSLSKEFLRTYYRTTPWYNEVIEAQEKSEREGVADWKKGVSNPPPLPMRYRELASQLYRVLTHCMTGREYFKDTWTLDHLEKEMQSVRAELKGG